MASWSHSDWLRALLDAALSAAKAARRSPVFFDIGARDGLSPTWDILARLGLISAVAFEPDAKHCAMLAERDLHVKYVQAALGDRIGERPFYLTRMPGCSSLRKPNQELLRQYPASAIFSLVGTTTLPVTTLAEVVRGGAAPAPDFLKIDTQGFEMEVLAGSADHLEGITGIQLEAQFKPMYEGQALFQEIKVFLESSGFILRALKPNGPYEGEMLEMDAFFSKRPALDDRLEFLRMWQLATELESPLFLSQMSDWQADWLIGLSEEQIALRQRLFGP